MSDKRVTVKDCPNRFDLYKVSHGGGRYYVFRVDVGFLSNVYREVGSARNLGDALDLVKSSSGGTRLQIDDW